MQCTRLLVNSCFPLIRFAGSLCALQNSHVIIYADELAYEALCGNYPAELLCRATPESFGKEFLDYKMAVRTVADIDEPSRIFIHTVQSIVNVLLQKISRLLLILPAW